MDYIKNKLSLVPNKPGCYQMKNKDVIKVITGVRRSGKSTIMFQYKNWLQDNGVSDKQIIYLNFENRFCKSL